MARKKQTEPDMPRYEQAIEELEQIVERIESGEIGLEEGITQYERGMKLIKHCRAVLDLAESKVKELALDEGSADTGEDQLATDEHG